MSCHKFIIFIRNVLQPPEELGDVEDCGIIGSKEYTEDNAASSLRSQPDATPVVPDRPLDEATIDECLWDCEWIDNPYYKKALLWRTKHFDNVTRDDTISYALVTSPTVPQNLICLEDCFSLFPSVPTFSEIQKQCSDQGFDRLVPTHTSLGQAYIESNYKNASLLSVDKNNKTDYTTTSWNPNLDCLEWIWKEQRQKGAEDNILSNLPTANISNIFNNALQTASVTTTARPTPVTTAPPTTPARPNPTEKKTTTTTTTSTTIQPKQPQNSEEAEGGRDSKSERKRQKEFRQALESKQVVSLAVQPDIDTNWWWMGSDQISNNVRAVHMQKNEISQLEDCQKASLACPQVWDLYV